MTGMTLFTMVDKPGSSFYDFILLKQSEFKHFCNNEIWNPIHAISFQHKAGWADNYIASGLIVNAISDIVVRDVGQQNGHWA